VHRERAGHRTRYRSRRRCRVHRERYRRDPDAISFEPGRAEVLGNHTTITLARSLRRRWTSALFAISRNQGGGFASSPANWARRFRTRSTRLARSWARHGLSTSREVYNLASGGLEVAEWMQFTGIVPIGSGLSSSAAIEFRLLAAMETRGARSTSRMWPPSAATPSAASRDDCGYSTSLQYFRRREA
jgi:galactokinase